MGRLPSCIEARSGAITFQTYGEGLGQSQRVNSTRRKSPSSLQKDQSKIGPRALRLASSASQVCPDDEDRRWQSDHETKYCHDGFKRDLHVTIGMSHMSENSRPKHLMKWEWLLPMNGECGLYGMSRIGDEWCTRF
jgi:hypothetical protein